MIDTPSLSIPYIISPSGCWVCSIGEDRNRYKVIQRGGKRVRAHRQAWIETNRPIPDGLQVLHHCDNPPCIRPDHLFLGTHDDNMADKAAKGRAIRGEASPSSVLVESEVRKIRNDPRTLRQIARAFAVSVGTVQRIKNGTRWKHVA